MAYEWSSIFVHSMRPCISSRRYLECLFTEMNLRQSYLSQNCRCFSKLVEMLTFIIDKLEATFGAEKVQKTLFFVNAKVRRATVPCFTVTVPDIHVNSYCNWGGHLDKNWLIRLREIRFYSKVQNHNVESGRFYKFKKAQFNIIQSFPVLNLRPGDMTRLSVTSCYLSHLPKISLLPLTYFALTCYLKKYKQTNKQRLGFPRLHKL